ncbi:hypothetical protein [Pontibacter harenae]|uniref:hypothetical protein n=1 Tax=Pontibacter harenae TaxID=2894083 RepID=UPI001E50185C|nr:hypothetical protein [Pontibacter harenae]MCC9168265.1 hypothetical protein [Pontibacter harenae]
MLFLLITAAQTAKANPDYVKAYYPLINEAELKVVSQQYDSALVYYQQAFTTVSAPLARDYYNAAVCAMLTANQKQTVEYLEQLVLKGVAFSYLESQPVFEELHTTRQWRKFRRKSRKYRRTFESTANLDLRADLDELYARDQYFRQAEGGLRVYRDTLREIESANVKMLLNWISQYGYPGEALVGVADTLEELPRYSIVIQRQTKLKGGFDFTSILTQAVHEGKLAPQAAAYLMDQQAGKHIYSSRAFIKVNCNNPEDCAQDKKLEKTQGYLVEKLSAGELSEVNERRSKLGLEPLADYRKKVRYNLQDDRFKLSYGWSVANYYVPSREAVDVIMEGLVEAE